MSDRRENSVLFSLRELRTIEEDRVKQEEEGEKARIDAELLLGLRLRETGTEAIVAAISSSTPPTVSSLSRSRSAIV